MTKAAELAFVRVQVPDLDEAERFFQCFGLFTRERTDDRLYLHGTGREHHILIVHKGERRLLSLAFSVGEAVDLVALAGQAGVPSPQPRNEPGGGRTIMLHDPDGNAVEIVHGIATVAPMDVASQLFNSASGRLRRSNSVIRPPKGPSRVLRLGHAVLRTPDVRRLSTWYQRTLGLLESDDVLLDDGADLLMSFVRLDQGDVPVDHHVFQALKGEANQLHHISFEVQDIDDLHMGHRALSEGGYRHVWGIGRHLQGSQIFDYWLDPFGTMFEHWTDSDMLDATVPKETRSLDDIESPWGPPTPPQFLSQGTR